MDDDAVDRREATSAHSDLNRGGVDAVEAVHQYRRPMRSKGAAARERGDGEPLAERGPCAGQDEDTREGLGECAGAEPPSDSLPVEADAVRLLAAQRTVLLHRELVDPVPCNVR